MRPKDFERMSSHGCQIRARKTEKKSQDHFCLFASAISSAAVVHRLIRSRRRRLIGSLEPKPNQWRRRHTRMMCPDIHHLSRPMNLIYPRRLTVNPLKAVTATGSCVCRADSGCLRRLWNSEANVSMGRNNKQTANKQRP